MDHRRVIGAVESEGRFAWAAGLLEYLRGLSATDLVEDIGAGPFTLVAPTRDAWRKLALPFERLLLDPSLVEARFDVFEYLVLRGIHFAHRERRSVATLQGGHLELGENRVVGRFGGANVVHSFVADSLLVHVVDGLVFPTAATWSSSRPATDPFATTLPLSEG